MAIKLLEADEAILWSGKVADEYLIKINKKKDHLKIIEISLFINVPFFVSFYPNEPDALYDFLIQIRD